MEIRYLKLDELVIDRPNRQRKKLIVDDLVDSISQNTEKLPATMGLIQPVVVRGGVNLVAGERRTEAFRQLGREQIPVIDLEELDDDTAFIIELEENYRRKSLQWQEEAVAIELIHNRFVAGDETWTQAQTATRLGIPQTRISQYLMVAEVLETDQEIRLANTLATAYGILQKRSSRELDDMATSIGFNLRNILVKTPMHNVAMKMAEPAHKPVLSPGITNLVAGIKLPEDLKPATIAPPPSGANSLICADFKEWVKTYKGPRFNLIHCDFPYVAGAGRKGSQIHAGGEGRSYEDSDSIFWELCAALVEGMANVVAGSAHILFWYQTSRFTEVFDFWETISKTHNLTVFDVPLIWHKSDGSGVVSDAGRRYRHVYENALLISRGDRKIIRTVADVYSAPISRDIHPSEKPEPMLREFFRALVSNTTRLLDPTAGSASALRAAESLGAEFVFGIEKDEKFHKESVEALDRFRRKKALEALSQKKETVE